LYFAACDRCVFLKTIIQMFPVRIHKNKTSPPWWEKENRPTKFSPKNPKKLTDEPSNQHRSPATTIFRDQTIDFDHRLINSAPAIRNGKRRPIEMTTTFECFKNLDACQGLIFGNPARYSQARISIQIGGTPKLSVFSRFRVPFFRLCCPRSPTLHPIDHV